MTQPKIETVAGAIPQAYVMGKQRAIRVDVDRKYRLGLIELVRADGGRQARWHIEKALANGPSRGGYAEALSFFGNEFDLKCKLTAPIVEACEVSLPGFGRWLELTGFGNDKSMICGFVAWAEYKNGKGKVMTERADKASGKS